MPGATVKGGAMRAARSGLARLLWALGLVLAVGWVYGWMVTDLTLLGQVLWWASLPVAALSIVLIALGWAAWPGLRAGRASRQLLGRGRDRPRGWSRWGCLVLGLVMVGGECWHGLNMASLVAPVRRVPPASLLVVHWNSSVGEVPDAAGIAARLGRTGRPDVVLTSMQNYHEQWDAIKAVMRSVEGEEIYFEFSGMQKVFSRYPIMSQRMFLIPVFAESDGSRVAPTIPAGLERALRRVFSGVGVYPRDSNRLDPASVMVIELDTTAHLGCVTTMYFVDYPSNPVAHRAKVARIVRAHLDKLRAGGPDSPPIPEASLIVGDFNTPRGSVSLDLLAPGYQPASVTAGLGVLATWPRRWSLLHIDHALVSPRWACEGYELLDPGISEHDAQRLRIWPAR